MRQALSRRESQIMDILHQQGECSAREILRHLPDPPTYSAVRALLAKLVEKRLVGFRSQGKRYLYAPTEDPASARRSALKHLVHTFFEDSPLKAANALLGMRDEDLDDEQLQQLRRLVDQLERENPS